MAQQLKALDAPPREVMNFQHLNGSLQPFATPVLGDPTPSSI